MKKQVLKKALALIVLPIIMFSVATNSARAQTRPDLGGGFPGDFCHCSVKYYGCAGNIACLTHCAVGCHSKTYKKAISRSQSLSDTYLSSDLQITRTQNIISESEMQKKLNQLEWGTDESLNPSASDKYLMINPNDKKAMKLYTIN